MAAKALDFDDVPRLTDILSLGGRPGFDYALVEPDKVNDLKMDDWDMVGNLPPITVAGIAMLLMGKALPDNRAIVMAGRPTSTIPNFYIDNTNVTVPEPDPRKIPAKEATG